MTEQQPTQPEAVVLPFRKPHRELIAGELVNLAMMSEVELELLETQLQARKDDTDMELYIVSWERMTREQPEVPGSAS